MLPWPVEIIGTGESCRFVSMSLLSVSYSTPDIFWQSSAMLSY